jgi:hypothetical protein
MSAPRNSGSRRGTEILERDRSPLCTAAGPESGFEERIVSQTFVFQATPAPAGGFAAPSIEGIAFDRAAQAPGLHAGAEPGDDTATVDELT